MILFLLLSALVMRGGIKQRLRVDEATEAPPAAETTVRGGLRQRFCSASSSSTAPRAKTAPHYAKRRKLEAEPEDVSNLPLTTSLRRDWARGILPSNRVLEYAAGAASQGARGLESFAGGDRNAHRRVVAALGYPEKAPRLSWIEIPVAGGGVKPQPILCPIDTLEALLKDPVKFQKHMRGEDLNVEDLWYGLSGTKVFTANKMHINVTRSLAITLHGDGAPTTKADGLFTISWSSLHASGSTRHTKNIFTVVRKKDMGPGTLDTLFNRLAWALNACCDGLMPEHDWQGKPCPDHGREIADGWRLVTIMLRGDWEFFTQVCNFPTWSSVPNMCWMCNASPTIGPLVWTNGLATAGWRATMRSHEQCVTKLLADGVALPAVFKIKTLRLEGVMGDVLHALDQGVATHVVGNVMVWVMRKGHWGGNQALQAAGLEEHLKTWYKRHKTMYKIQGKIPYERVKASSDWPKFKAKAAATRHLAHYAEDLAREFSDGSVDDQKVVAVAAGLARMYTIMKEQPRFLSRSAKAELTRLSVAFMDVYSQLADAAVAAKVRMWKMSPKFHILQHICEHQSWFNPRMIWCYGDEDLQHLVKEVALSCHPTTTAHMTLYKWVVCNFTEGITDHVVAPVRG